MKEYRNPIKMATSDPICSASALGNTIIGILFDKKGSEIRQAIKARTATIDKKVDEYQEVLSKIDKFIEEKKIVLKNLDDFYCAQADKKTAFIKPYQDKLEIIHKEFTDKTNEINKDLSNAVFVFDKDTASQVGKQAVEFEKSFDDFKSTFSDVSKFLKKEREKNKEPIRGVGFGDGVTGLQGPTGTKGMSGTVGTGNTNPFSYVSPGVFTNTLYEATEEDEATARLNTLRSLLSDYSDDAETLKNVIFNLNEEKRRLKLISDNIDPDRDYKLDLNKLSAFGFEDIEIN